MIDKSKPITYIKTNPSKQEDNMNRTRIKFADKGAYYHLFNRVGGPVIKTPFKAADREYGVRLLTNLCDYFLLEIISFAWMGNHFHLVAYAPPVDSLPGDVEIAERHNRYVTMMRKRYPTIQLAKLTRQTQFNAAKSVDAC